MQEICRIMPWPRKGRTSTDKLPGGDFGTSGLAGYRNDLNIRYSWLPARQIERYVQQFGTRADELLAGATGVADLGFHIGADLYQREVDFLIDTEWAVTADDVIWRRTKTGLHLTSEEVRRLAEYMEATA